MIVPKLSAQQVTGALRATGSNDPDVLFAKKEELLAESRRLKLLGIVPIIVGAAMSLTILGAVVGIPAIWVGFSVRKTIAHNVKTAEEGLANYLRSVQTGAVQGVA